MAAKIDLSKSATAGMAYATDGLRYFNSHAGIELQGVRDSHIAITVVLLTAISAIFYWRTSRNKIPFLNNKLSTKEIKDNYLANTKAIVDAWFQKHPNKPAMMHAEVGPILVLPWSMADEIKNDTRFSLHEQVAKTFYSYIPGFEVFRNDFNAQLRIAVIKKHINKQLFKMTAPLAEEAEFALSSILPQSHTWQSINVQEMVLQLVTRLSSHIFLGPELCRNPDWIRMSAGYAGVVVRAWDSLNFWPSWTRLLASRFLPKCRETRSYVDGVREVLRPIIEKRRRDKERAAAKGESLTFNDAIDWLDIEADGKPYDAEIVQLMLSVASVHTTTDLLSQTLSDIASHPEIIEPLRKEMVSVLKNRGWQKNSLDKMLLLDSVIKESQRLKPSTTISMGRLTTTQIKLSDGSIVPKGTFVGVDMSSMWDPRFHTAPEAWDGYRYYNLRNAPIQKQNAAKLITTTPEHLSFGYGVYECPGRFFAANEIKIAITSLLLNYDIKLDGAVPKPIARGIQLIFDPRQKLSVRRREEPILVI